MSSSTDIDFETRVQSLAETCGLGKNLVSVTSLCAIRIEEIERAVIFYHGIWSGPSVAVFRLLCTTIAESEKPVPVMVVNADELSDAKPELHQIAADFFGPSIGAWGETCWIRTGQIIGRDVLWWKNGDRAQQHTLARHYHRRVQASDTETRELIRRRINELFFGR